MYCSAPIVTADGVADVQVQRPLGSLPSSKVVSGCWDRTPHHVARGPSWSVRHRHRPEVNRSVGQLADARSCHRCRSCCPVMGTVTAFREVRLISVSLFPGVDTTSCTLANTNTSVPMLVPGADTGNRGRRPGQVPAIGWRFSRRPPRSATQAAGTGAGVQAAQGVLIMHHGPSRSLRC